MGETMGTIAEKIADRLARYLGPHTARVAVKTFAAKSVGRAPETLTAADVPAVAAALRPMLRTMIGKQRGEMLVEQIVRELAK